MPTGDAAGRTTSGTPRRRTTLSKRCFFSVVPLCLLLLAAEGACRLFQPRAEKSHGAGVVPLIPDPDLLWRPDPASPLANELGVFDTRFRPDTDRRILLLGDSVGVGDGMYAVDTFAFRLERKLEARLAPQTVEIVNSSTQGWCTAQQSIYLRREGLALEPDLVILQFCLNDVGDLYYDIVRFDGPNVVMGVDTRQSLGGALGFLFRYSRAAEGFVRLLQRNSRRRQAWDVERLCRDLVEPDVAAHWQETFVQLERIRAATAERNIPLVLVVAPYRIQTADPLRLRQPQDRLIAWAAEHGVAVVDLLPAFSADGLADHRFHDENHFSVFGHETAADELLDVVARALSAVKPRRSSNRPTTPRRAANSTEDS